MSRSSVRGDEWRIDRGESIKNFDLELGRLQVPTFLFLAYAKLVRLNRNRTHSNRSQIARSNRFFKADILAEIAETAQNCPKKIKTP